MQVEVAVDDNGNCINYCPLDDPPLPAMTLVGDTDMGPVTINGQKLEWFQGVQSFLNITLENE